MRILYTAPLFFVAALIFFLMSNRMLKKSILDFFNSLRRGACPRLAPFFKHLRA